LAVIQIETLPDKHILWREKHLKLILLLFVKLIFQKLFGDVKGSCDYLKISAMSNIVK